MDVKEINNGDGTISLCFEIDDELYNQHTEILAPKGLNMENAKLEQEIIRKYIVKERQDRLLWELNSPKK